MDTSCCRLCMQEHIHLFYIYGIHRGVKICDLINKFIPEIKLDESENLSKIICENCFTILANADALRRSSIENDKKQRVAIGSKMLIVKVEPVEAEVKVEIIDDFQDSFNFDDQPYDDDSETDKCDDDDDFVSFSKVDVDSYIDGSRCKICKKVFGSPWHVRRHVATIHEKGEIKPQTKVEAVNPVDNIYIDGSSCKICSKVFGSPWHARRHVITIHKKDELKPKPMTKLPKPTEDDFKCKKCGKEFVSVRNVRRHMRDVHEKDPKPSRKSPTIGDLLKVNLDLQIENVMKQEKEKEMEEFTCKVCHKVFGRKSSVTRHLRTVHGIRSSGPKLTVDKVNEFSLENRTCSRCNKVFSRPFQLMRHLKNIHKIQSKSFYVCDLCPEMAFKQRAKLEWHMIVEHQKKKLKDLSFSQCIECFKTFLSGDDLVSHQFYVHGMKSDRGYLTCDKCGEDFKIKALLQRHLLANHLQVYVGKASSAYFECNTCRTTYLNFEELQTHSLFAHDKPVYKNDCMKSTKMKGNKVADKNEKESYDCAECGMSFENRRDAGLHSEIHSDFIRQLTDEERAMMIYKCILCPFQFEQESFLNLHLEYHAADFTPTKVNFCNSCSKLLQDFETLQSHAKEHNEDVTHECMKCQKRFVEGTKFFHHIYRHKRAERCKCSYENCDFKCRDQRDLDDHIRIKHFEEVVNLCFTCGESFATVKSLRSHIRGKHENPTQIYQCPSCPKTFNSVAKFKNHQVVHTTEFNFKCEHPGCTKVFKSKRNLKKHLEIHDATKHYKKFSCEHCDMKFYTRDHQRKHAFTHTGEKPYTCTFAGCDRAFAQSNDLNKHLRSHYNQEETYFCSYQNCKQSFKFLNDLRFHEGIHFQNKDQPSRDLTLKNSYYGKDD